jgi:uncharacterized protein YbjT (DUF2867 family)
MRIVVFGGSGLIGGKLATALYAAGHHVVSASRASGVDVISGEGLAETLTGAHAVVDVTESSSHEDWALLDFFVTSSRNLLAAEVAAGIGHHVALSVVGVDQVKDSGYFRAKLAQEEIIKASPIPYTIVRSTQFFDFMDRIVRESTDGNTVRVSPVMIQPVAPDDVADALAEIATSPPLNGIVELAGSEAIRLDELTRLVLSGHEDPRTVVADPHARFFGAELGRLSLMPSSQLPNANLRIGPSTARDWLRHFITAD